MFWILGFLECHADNHPFQLHGEYVLNCRYVQHCPDNQPSQLHGECPESFLAFLICCFDTLSRYLPFPVARGVPRGGLLCNSTGRLQRRGSLGREKEETGTCSSFFNYKDHIIKHQKAYGMLVLVIRHGGEGRAQNVTMWLGRQSG